MKFFIGLHRLSLCRHFPRSFVSVNRLRNRRIGFLTGGPWIMDSGAFTEITTHGRYRSEPDEYVRYINRWASSRTLVAAVSQDYMCEEFVLDITGLTVADHQELTIDRYDRILALRPRVQIIPVLQGYDPSEYVSHLEQYGDRLTQGMWVGVGSICKRNAEPELVYQVLAAIKDVRPDLRIHGFGLKITALEDARVVALLHTADSMAWSYAARMSGRDQNSLEEAMRFWKRVHSIPGVESGNFDFTFTGS